MKKIAGTGVQIHDLPTKSFFKRCPGRGANLGSFWFFIYFLSLKQRLRPLGYCAPLPSRSSSNTTSIKVQALSGLYSQAPTGSQYSGGSRSGCFSHDLVTSNQTQCLYILWSSRPSAWLTSSCNKARLTQINLHSNYNVLVFSG